MGWFLVGLIVNFWEGVAALTIGFFVLWMIFRKTRKRSIRFASCSLLVIALTFDLYPGYRKYRSLCHNESGENIYRTVENVSAIRIAIGTPNCSTLCRRLLKGYEFIELEFDEPQMDYAIRDPGIYRFHLAARGSASCQSNHAATRYAWPGVCIAAEPIPEFSTPYVVGPIERSEKGEEHGYKISSIELKITDVETGEVLSRTAQFHQPMNWSFFGTSAFLGGLGPTFCPGRDGYSRPDNVDSLETYITDVLQPKLDWPRDL